MNNPENNNKSISDLLLDARGQLLNIQASMELASIAASTLQVDAESLAAFIDLVSPTIGFLADQLEDIDQMIFNESRNEEKAPEAAATTSGVGG